MASSSVKQPIEGLTLSNTFRTGLAGLAKNLSIELASDGILVNEAYGSLHGKRGDASAPYGALVSPLLYVVVYRAAFVY